MTRGRQLAATLRCGPNAKEVSFSGDDAVPAVQSDGESTPGSDTEDPGPSTSRGITVRCEREKSFVFAAADDDVVPAVQDVGDRLPQRKRTVQIHLEPRFVYSEGAEKQASSVRDALREVSATERKFGFAQQTEQTSATKEDEFTLIQVSAMNSLIGPALCPKCCKKTLSVQHGTKLGLAVKLVLLCASCGPIHSPWSSSRKSEGRAFEVNLRAMQAIKSIGKGPTALNDFWATMNVSHRGIHQKPIRNT
ncbi:hypothetical protein HPB51_003025 [Rhipicephalus microplus]|uniref:Mutator-like transposase domain-containing protein n=1 Tax=Rhipicephalus microplus TaxID=6941 RepID=A0A9J6DSB3_RHIMP|nr:hypothetical protein HPB51_003025 [Rhipicephalus microplus]